MGAATDTCTGDAATTVGGTGAGATISIVTTDKASLDSRSPSHCPGEREWQRRERSRLPARPVQRAPNGRARSAEFHLHRDPDQIRVILGAELLLEQRSGVCDRLVGNLQRIGDFDDLVAAAQ